MPLHVSVYASGEFFVRDGRVYPVTDSYLQETDEEHIGYLVWVPLNDDGEPLQCGW